jgi:hypothetical protein
VKEEEEEKEEKKKKKKKKKMMMNVSVGENTGGERHQRKFRNATRLSATALNRTNTVTTVLYKKQNFYVLCH